MKRLVWSILLVLPLGATADIYRSVDENGQVVYSDRPSSDAERITVSAAPAFAPAAEAAPAGEDEDAEADEDSTVFAEVPREPTPEELAADRGRNCEYSRQMLESYTTSHRLYRQGPDGEREYLSAEEIDAARARAQSNVAAWCD
ncbi:MAG TPA: DUF4124 domain-containing protein [Gammaproteobacteria bacterium]|nr:DUF4124 domain-containing protein [Gammaproteobacteria bacterium]